MGAIKNVTLVGGNGNLGAVLLETLVAAGDFRVTVLKRASSKSPTVAPSVRVIQVDDAWTTEALTAALAGADAAIACFPLRDTAQHLRLADAAAAAGVARFIPADYGSVDARSPRARELVRLFDNKVKVRERLEALSAQSGGALTWTSLVNGHFFDWGLTNGFLHFDVARRTAEILGDGTARSSNATLARISEAVVRILRKPDETRNRVLMVQSFCVSQLDILRSLERVTGAPWEAVHVDLDAFVQKHKALADQGSKESIEDLVFALGVMEGNWEDKEDFAMDLLGFENEDLDTVVRKAIAEKEES